MPQLRRPIKGDFPFSADPGTGVGEPAFDRVVGSLAADPEVTLSRMFGSPSLKTGSKVFAMFVKGSLVVKLARHRADAIVASCIGEYFDPGHGRLMKEWVAVGAESSEDWLGLASEAKAEALIASQRVPRRSR